MRILRKADQVYIAKRLAAIYYTAVHWQEEEWEDFVKCVVGNVCDIANAVGGERMMTLEVPMMVEALNRKLHERKGERHEHTDKHGDADKPGTFLHPSRRKGVC